MMLKNIQSVRLSICIITVLFLELRCVESDRATTAGRPSDYCKPSESCWPTEDHLKEFSDSLDGSLLTPSSPQYPNASLINNRRFIERPGMIVEVSSADDVVLSLKFARDHNIRVSIVSTGHDYDGRNSGNDTLQLSFKTMKKKSIIKDRDVFGIRVEPGNTWADVHNYVRENMRDKIAVGGSDPSVGVAGWVLGGGHSPFSSMAGLGVDSALSFDMVLANGSIITANNKENSEIFWALRGGGGGTFGVVVNITFMLHDNPGPIQVLNQSFPLNKHTGLPSLIAFGKWLSTASSNVSGYVSLQSNPAVSMRPSFIQWYAIYRGSYENARKEFKNILSLPSHEQNFINGSDAYDYLSVVPSDNGGYSIYLFNSLVGNDSLADGHSLNVAFSYVKSRPLLRPTGRVCTGSILGGAVATAGKISGATAIHPGFRKARMALSCGEGWTASGDYPKAVKDADEWAKKLYKYGDGAYYNEPQSNLEDWKVGFWGSAETYERLLKVKNEVDPDFLFNCHHCVGYEE